VIAILRMTGRCANGAERDGGRLWHAVRATERSGLIGVSPWATAVCGKIPGHGGNGWSGAAGDEITCKRCIARLAQTKRFASDEGDHD